MCVPSPPSARASSPLRRAQFPTRSSCAQAGCDMSSTARTNSVLRIDPPTLLKIPLDAEFGKPRLQNLGRPPPARQPAVFHQHGVGIGRVIQVEVAGHPRRRAKSKDLPDPEV